MASVTVFGNTDVADTGMMPPAYIVQEMKEELLQIATEVKIDQTDSSPAEADKARSFVLCYKGTMAFVPFAPADEYHLQWMDQVIEELRGCSGDAKDLRSSIFSERPLVAQRYLTQMSHSVAAWANSTECGATVAVGITPARHSCA